MDRASFSSKSHGCSFASQVRVLWYFLTNTYNETSKWLVETINLAIVKCLALRVCLKTGTFIRLRHGLDGTKRLVSTELNNMAGFRESKNR